DRHQPHDHLAQPRPNPNHDPPPRRRHLPPRPRHRRRPPPPLIAFIILFSIRGLSRVRRPTCHHPPARHIVRMPTTKRKRTSVKSAAMQLVHSLPASSTWDDLMYRIYVRQKIDQGLADIKADRTHTHAS